MAEVVSLPIPPERQPDSDDLTDATLSEDMVARVFAQKYAGHLAYCHDHGKWFEFDGTVWRIQRTPLAFHYARQLARNISLQRGSSAASMQKVRFAAGVEKFAQADPVFARTADFWDRDIMLLGTPDGTVDLKTGRLRDSMQSDFITKSTAIAPDEFGYCPLWMKFIHEATGNDEEMVRFLQQICGYSLTGSIAEQSLFFIHGPGGAGKGVFLNTIKHILGDYAKTAASEVFAARKLSAHPTEMAYLQGARMVATSETEEGSAWAEAKLKNLTGGDPIQARFMRQDFFEYIPQFTLIIIGNHKPTLKTVDEAMRRRFNILPFTRIPDTPDRELQEKLYKEAAGILHWMIKGCIDWKKNGLVRPASVIEATAEYFEEQNTMSEWFESACNITRGNTHLRGNPTALFKSWHAFARQSGIEAGTTKTFKPALEREGFPQKRKNKERYFEGIELIPEQEFNDNH